MHLIAFSHGAIRIGKVIRTVTMGVNTVHIAKLPEGFEVEVLPTDVLASYNVTLPPDLQPALTEARTELGKKTRALADAEKANAFITRSLEIQSLAHIDLITKSKALEEKLAEAVRERDEYKGALRVANEQVLRFIFGKRDDVATSFCTHADITKAQQERDEATVQWRRATVENLDKADTIRALEIEVERLRGVVSLHEHLTAPAPPTDPERAEHQSLVETLADTIADQNAIIERLTDALASR